MAALTGRSAEYVARAVGVCRAGVRHWRADAAPRDSLAGLYRARHADLNATLLARCVKLRLPAYQAFAGRTPGSRAVRRAVYAYVRAVAARHPGCRTRAGGGMPPDAGGDSAAAKPTSHQVLINK